MSRSRRLLLLLVGLAAIVISLALLAFALWPLEPARDLWPLAPTLFAPPR